MEGAMFQIFVVVLLCSVRVNGDHSLIAYNATYFNSDIDLTGCTSVIYQLKACPATFVALTKTYNGYSTDIYEFGMAGGLGTSTATISIKKNLNIVTSTAVTTPLSCSSYAWFWISWLNGVIRFGKGNVTSQNQILMYNDTTPIQIVYFSASGPKLQAATYCYYLIPDYSCSTATTKVLNYSTSLTSTTPTVPSSSSDRIQSTALNTGFLTTHGRTLPSSIISTNAKMQTDPITSSISPGLLVASQTTLHMGSLQTSSPGGASFLGSTPILSETISSDISRKTSVGKSGTSSSEDTSRKTSVGKSATSSSEASDMTISSSIDSPTVDNSLATAEVSNSHPDLEHTSFNSDGQHTTKSLVLPSNRIKTSIPNTFTSSLHTSKDPLRTTLLSSSVTSKTTEQLTSTVSSPGHPSSKKFMILSTQLSIQASQSTSSRYTIQQPTYPRKKAVVMPCPSPPEIQNATMTVYSWRSDTGFAVYTCLLGYRFKESGTTRSITCFNGTWINAEMDGCQPVLCSPATSVTNTQPSPESISVLSVGEMIRVQCSSEHEIFDYGFGFSMSKCTVIGIQTREHANCSVNTCRPPPFVAHSIATFQPQQRQVSLTCLSGFRFSNGKSRFVGKWDAEGGWRFHETCQTCYCSSLTLLNGVTDRDEVGFGTTVVAHCNEGFKFPNNDLTILLECVDLGGTLHALSWNDTLPDCQPVYCTPPPVVRNAHVSGITNSSHIYGAMITYRCSKGLRFEDGYMEKNITCGGTGQWNETEFTCDVDRCEPVPSVGNAMPVSRSALKGLRVEFVCNVGFQDPAEGVLYSTCDGTRWSRVAATGCKPVVCPTLNVTHGFVNLASSSSRQSGTNATITCDEGHLIDGQQYRVVTCLPNGNWSTNAAIIRCSPVDCGPAPQLTVAYADLTSARSTTYYGSRLTYLCPAGFWFSRGVVSQTITCRSDGNWTAFQQADCSAVTCFPLVFYISNTTSTGIGTVVNVSCPSGSTFANTKEEFWSSTCNILGHWEPSIPGCIQEVGPRATSPGTTEATGSRGVGAACVCVMATCVLLSIIIDLSSFKRGVALMKMNCNSS